MQGVRILVSYNGQWEESAEQGWRYSGAITKGLFVPRNTTYEQLLMEIQSFVPYDSSTYDLDLKTISVGQGGQKTMNVLNDDKDVLFMLADDRYLPQVCVSVVCRTHDIQVAAIDSLNRHICVRRHEDNVRKAFDHIASDSGSNQFAIASHRNDAAINRQRESNGRMQQVAVNEPHTENVYSGPETYHAGPEVVEQVVPHPQLDEPFNDFEGNDWSEANPNSNERHEEDEDEEVRGRNVGASPSQVQWEIPGAESHSFSKVSVEPDIPTGLIYKGQFFPRKKDLKRALGLYSLKKNFEMKVKRSTKSLLHVTCKEPTCIWKCRAVKRNEGSYFQIRGFVDEHTCPIEEVHRRHRQASYKIIGEVVTPRLQAVDGRVMRPKDIIADMKEMYGIQILYSKAHMSLKYALQLTYGSAEDSYQNLPGYCWALKQTIPGTFATYQLDYLGRFMYFFMALGPSLRGFRRFMRPVIAIDGTHLKGQYKGTMFVAAAKDGNEQIYPIAFGYGDSETNAAWEWFLSHLKTALGPIDELVFISDKATSIERGVRMVFPDAVHGLCAWHLGENIKKHWHRDDLKKMFNLAARVYTENEYNEHMAGIESLHRRCYDDLIAAEPHKWSRVHCPRRRYQVMTTNIAESLNSCLRFARQLPIMTLAEFIRNMLQRWYYDRKQAAENMRHQLTEAAIEEITKRMTDIQSMTARHVDWNIFEVKQGDKQWTVNLLEKSCTCNVFQMSLLPCSHALVAARERNMDYTTFCADYYKRSHLAEAYSEPILPVSHPSQWNLPEDVRAELVVPPDVRRQSGRPRLSRIRSAHEGMRSRVQKCTKCGLQGHNSKRCNNPTPVQEGPSSAPIAEQYRRRCGHCKEVGHNRQTCPELR